MRFDPLRPRHDDRPGSGTRLNRRLDPLTIAAWLLVLIGVGVWVAVLFG